MNQPPAGQSLRLASLVILAVASLSHGGLTLHWKLDEPDGDYTSPPGYREEINNTSANAFEIASGSDILEGAAGLVEDAGTCISLADTKPGSYIDAGTVQADGMYVAGRGDGSFRVLSGAYTVTACARYSGEGDRTIISSEWNARTGWMLGFRDGEIFFDFGNLRTSTGEHTVTTDRTYLISVRFDSTRSIFGGGTNDYRISFWDGATWTHSDGIADHAIRLQGLAIGAFGDGTREMVGQIDDVRIYDHTLTQDELDGLAGGVAPLVLGPVNVTRISPTEADVECLVNLDAVAVTVYWGTSDPGDTPEGWTGTPVALGEQEAGSVPTTLTGLSENTTYFFRYYGSSRSPEEEAWSPAGTFTTTPSEPLPRLGIPSATAPHDEGAEVQCRLLDAAATSTWVTWDTADRGTPATPPGGWAHATELGSALKDDVLLQSITGVAGDTTCFFRFFAANDVGSDWSDSATFDTGLGHEAAPTGLAVDLMEGVMVRLSWIDAYATETGFIIQRAEDEDFTHDLQAFDLPADSTTYLDRTGAPATTYFYRAAAWNAGGQTPFSPFVTAITGGHSPPVPILHWKLDDAGLTFREEITEDAGIAVAVNTVTTGQPALAPDGGSSISLTSDDPGSCIDAGTVQEDNTYVAGLGDGTFRVLSGAYTVTAWANYAGLTHADRVIISSDWNASTGWSLGFRDAGIFFDFGTSRRSTGVETVSTDTTYLISVRFDDTRTIFGGGINEYSISFWDGSTWIHSDGAVNRSIGLQGLEIGAVNTGTRQIEGLLDDIRIYNVALTQADLDTLAGRLVLGATLGPATNELTFTWNGDSGKTYNLLANPDLSAVPSTWGVILSEVISPQTIARPTPQRTFYLLEETP